MSRSLTKKEAQQQQVQQQNQYARDTVTDEKHASAQGSAGLNLNILGAVSGALSSKSKKTTHQNADGSSDTVEERAGKGSASGAAQGNGSAFAQGSADEGARKTKSREIGQGQSQAQQTTKTVDHLGIEG